MTDSITPTQHSSLVGGSTAARRIGALDPSPQDVRRFLHYDPKTGRFWHKIRSYDTFNGTQFIKVRNGKAWNQRCAGKRACTARSGTGHMTGRLMGKGYGAHRLAWLHYYGEPIPDGMFVDHINGDRADNRIVNLRLVTPQQSVYNTGPQKNSTSGAKGVYWDKQNKKWKASIKHEGKEVWLGRFESFEKAVNAYQKAAESLHGAFAVHLSRGGRT